MAARTKGATPLSESDLIEEIVNNRLGSADVSKAQVKHIIKALKEEIADCLQSGYKVTLSGLLTIVPSSKPGRKKGTVVRNPFDGTTKTLRSDEPDKFKVKARVSASVVNGFPSAKSADGQALLKQLTPAKKSKPKGK